MFADTQVTQGKPLLSYVIASSNMRYIEINERDIYLRDDPQLGPVLRGEIPECGADCHTNLSQMLLEQAMSCDDCRDQAATARHVDHFGERLGEQLIAAHSGNLPEMMTIILNSMDVSFEKVVTAVSLQFNLAHCPIQKVATSSASNLWTASARRAFVTLCSSVVQALAPEWMLTHPTFSDIDKPLDKILISK